MKDQFSTSTDIDIFHSRLNLSDETSLKKLSDRQLLYCKIKLFYLNVHRHCKRLKERRGGKVVKTENRSPIKIQLCDMDFVVLVEKYKFSLILDNFNDSKL
jgi:hypothetical protein